MMETRERAPRERTRPPAPARSLSRERAAQDPESARLSARITALAATLTAFGVVMIYSASSVGIGLRHDDVTEFLRKQALWVSLALIVFAMARTTTLESLERHAKPILLGVVLVLVLVLIPGVGYKTHGARRWIRVAGLTAEPSEL
ncbi:FtsW/RodA/SpoVE family cell cycle protein, partial [bacterium]|nr:FtsW/RodA/SpoVE family cell cycle protein [bacterium]